ncbi:binding-protein-dependent transport systems inner membrane component [Candidatus Halobonum tyrrellensis G22]|uniref:Binding-protein-dependent transport systems inner membrane component n=1 Tax=Candidatus Halobonum tyrrellensis G22 TaxID=1324957 RepID=V4J373_9EURY|nr:binding-protein-dependent transport systems inner membrane component [Candidatus Halobonum tyrrellensis G22]
MIPATLLMLLIIVYPTVRAVWMSFHQRSFLSPEESTWVGIANYEALLEDPVFTQAFVHTIIFTVGAVVAMYVLGLGLALLLRNNLPGVGYLRSLSMVPWVIPPVVIVIIWTWMFQVDYGLVNLISQQFGGPNKYWFGDYDLALPLVMMLRVWKDTPFVAIALLASMQSIPPEYYEAAKIDGAGAVQQFRHITLPNISYISMVMIVTEVIAAFNSFQMIYIATGGGPVNQTEVLGTYVYQQAFGEYMLGYAAAVGIVMLALLTLFTAVYIKVENTE